MVLFLLDVKKAFYQPVPEGRLNWVSTSVCVGVCVCVCVFLCVSLFVSLYRSICVLLCVTLSESRCEFLYNVGEWRLTIDSSDVTYRRTTVGEAGWFIAAMVWVPLCFSSCLSGCPCVCVCVCLCSAEVKGPCPCVLSCLSHTLVPPFSSNATPCLGCFFCVSEFLGLFVGYFYVFLLVVCDLRVLFLNFSFLFMCAWVWSSGCSPSLWFVE